MKIRESATIVARRQLAPPELVQLTHKLAEAPWPDLRSLLPQLGEQWNRPRTDLYLWVDVLNRFDDFMSEIGTKYMLETTTNALGNPSCLGADDEQSLVIMLDFTRILLEHSSNRSIYASISEVMRLLQVSSIKVVTAALKLLLKVSLRYIHLEHYNLPAPLKLSKPGLLAKLSTIIPEHINGKRLEYADFVSAQFQPPPAMTHISIAYVENSQIKHCKVASEAVRTQSLDEILKHDCNGPAALDLLNAARLSKAVLGSAEDRTELVEMQAYAVGLASQLLPPRIFKSAVTSISPSCLKLIANLVVVSDDMSASDYANSNATANVPLALQVAGMDILINLCQDYRESDSIRKMLLRRMGTMGFLSILSQLTLQVQNTAIVDEEYVILFFRLLVLVIGTSSASSNLVPLLLEFIKATAQSDYLHLQCEAMVLLDALVIDSPSAMPTFLSAGGVQTLVELLAAETNPEELDSLPESPPTLAKVDYTLSYYRVQSIKSFLVVLSNIMKHKRVPELINKLMNSNVLVLCTSIVTRHAIFGWRVVSLAIQTISLMQEHEQSTVASMLEQGSLQGLLDVLRQLLLLSPHYYAPTLQMITALSSSDQGTDLLKESQLIELFFDGLGQSDLTSNGSSSLSNVGQALETLLSEQPEYLTTIMPKLVSFLELVLAQLSSFPDDTESRIAAFAGETDASAIAEASKAALVVQNVLHLLGPVLNNHKVMIEFLKLHPIDLLIDILTHRALPSDFVQNKEWHRPGNALAAILQGLFALEFDTDYVLGTWLGRLKVSAEDARKKLEPLDFAGFSLSNALRQSTIEKEPVIDFLSELSRLGFLLAGLRLMVFTDIGTGYRPMLTLWRLADSTYEPIFPALTVTVLWAIKQYSRMFADLSPDFIVASWPLYVHDWDTPRFTAKTTRRDQRVRVKEAELKILSSDGLSDVRVVKAARGAVFSFQLITGWFYGVTTGFTGLLLSMKPENKKRMLKLADQTAQSLTGLISGLLSSPWDVPTPIEKHACMTVARILQRSLSARSPNPFPAYVMFKQRSGIQLAFALLARALKKFGDGPGYQFDIFGTGRDIEFLVQEACLGAIVVLTNRADILGRNVQMSEFVKQGKTSRPGEQFDLVKFFIDVRSIALNALKQFILSKEVQEISAQGTQLLLTVIESVFAEGPEDIGEPRAWDDPALESAQAVQMVQWSQMIDLDEATSQLVAAGLTESEARQELAAASYDLAKAAANLQASGRLAGFVLPERPSLDYSDSVPRDGNTVITSKDDLEKLRVSIVGDASNAIFTFLENPNNATFAIKFSSIVLGSRFLPSLLSDHAPQSIISNSSQQHEQALIGLVHGLRSRSDMSKISRSQYLALLFKHGAIHCETMRREALGFLISAQSLILEAESINQTWLPYVCAVLEQVLVNLWGFQTPFGELQLAPDASSAEVKTVLRLQEVFDHLAAQVPLLSDKLAMVSVARVLVLLASLSPEIAASLFRSGVLEQLMAIRHKSGKYAKPLGLCIVLLVRFAARRGDELVAYMSREIQDWAEAKREPFPPESIAKEFVGFFAASPLYFFKAVTDTCSLVVGDENEFFVASTRALQETRERLYSEAQSHKSANPSLPDPPVTEVHEPKLDLAASGLLPTECLPEEPREFAVGLVFELLNTPNPSAFDIPVDDLEAMRKPDVFKADPKYSDQLERYLAFENSTALRLVLVQELMRSSSAVRDHIAEHVLSDDGSGKRFSTIMELYRRHHEFLEPRGNFELRRVQQGAEDAWNALQAFVSALVNLSENEDYKHELLPAYVSRIQDLVDALVSVVQENVKRLRSRQGGVIDGAAYEMLHSLITMFYFLLKDADPRWSLYEKTPILPKVMVKSKVLNVLSEYAGLLEFDHPAVPTIRTSFLGLVSRLVEFDATNHTLSRPLQDPIDDWLDEMLGGNDSGSDESQYQYREDWYGEDGDEEDGERANPFRHSALGMLEGSDDDSERDSSHIESGDHADYDHVTDDELLSDVGDDHEEDDGDITGSEMSDELDEEDVEVVEDEVDMEIEDGDGDEDSDMSGTEIEVEVVDAGFDSELEDDEGGPEDSRLNESHFWPGNVVDVNLSDGAFESHSDDDDDDDEIDTRGVVNVELNESVFGSHSDDGDARDLLGRESDELDGDSAGSEIEIRASHMYDHDDDTPPPPRFVFANFGMQQHQPAHRDTFSRRFSLDQAAYNPALDRPELPFPPSDGIRNVLDPLGRGTPVEAPQPTVISVTAPLSSKKRWDQLAAMFNIFTVSNESFRKEAVVLLEKAFTRPQAKEYNSQLMPLLEYYDKYVRPRSDRELDLDASEGNSEAGDSEAADDWESVDEDDEAPEEDKDEGEDEDEDESMLPDEEAPEETPTANEPNELAPSQGSVDVDAEAGQTPMEGVEDEAHSPAEPMIVNFRGNDVDIRDLGIDAQFFVELPEDLQQEVLEQQISALTGDRAPSEQEDGSAAVDEPAQAGTDPDFMLFINSLDPDERQDILTSIPGQGDTVIMTNDLVERLQTFIRPNLVEEARSAEDEHESSVRQRIAAELSAAYLSGPRSSRDSKWPSAPLKSASGISEWTPILDKPAIAVLLRFLQQHLPSGGQHMLGGILEKLSDNKKLKERILMALLHVIHNATLESVPVEPSPVLFSSMGDAQTVSSGLGQAPPYMVLRQALSLLNSWVRLVPEGYQLLLKPFNSSRHRRPAFLFNTALALLNKQVIVENSTILTRLLKVLLEATRPLLEKHKEETGTEAAGNGAEAGSRGITEDEPDADTGALDPLPMSSQASTGVATPSDTALVGGNTVRQSTPLPAAPGASTGETSVELRIPSNNLDHLLSVLTAKDCSAQSFNQVLGIVTNISMIPGIVPAVRSKLSKDARSYRHQIMADLVVLAKSLETEGSGPAVVLPVPPQTKLLRVLTAIDYLYDPKRDSDSFEKSKDRLSELMDIFKTIDLNPLWQQLSRALAIQPDTEFQLANSMLPLIECLTVVSKRVLSADRADPFVANSREILIEFTSQHKKVMNYLVRSNPKLLSGSFAVLAKDPHILDFDNKQSYFRRKMREEKARLGPQYMRLRVRRDQVFLDTYRSLFFKDATEIKRADVEVVFQGEEAIDAGGVSREWYSTLSRQIFNPDYALFTPLAASSAAFHANRTSWVNPEHLSFFKFVGRIIGKAVYDGRIMECYFSRVIYKYLLGKEVVLQDLEAVDEDYYKSLMWMLENDITDVMSETFSVDVDDYGDRKTVELIPGGANINVTEENKKEYVQLIARHTLVTSVEKQLEQLAKGFQEIIPQKFLGLFDEKELELLISGLPDIDVDDWRNNSSYQNYTVNSPQVKWFWRAVSSFDQEERARLLQFVVGTSKVPLSGFAELESSRGVGRFTILRDFGDNNRWPSAHTCTNQLNLPLYSSYEQLRSALLKAITEGSTGFGFA